MAKQRVRRRRRDHRGVKILELPGRGLVCRWTDPVDGRQRQQSMAPLGITNRVQAEQWARARSNALLAERAEFKAGGALAVRVPLQDAMNDYLKGYGSSTVKSKRRILADLVASLERSGVADMASISGPLLARWRDSLTGPTSRLARTTQNLRLATGAAWCNWAIKRGMAPMLRRDVVGSALQRVRVPKDAIRFLRPPELRKLLEAALRHDPEHPEALPVAGLLLLEVTTGMRLNELLGLRWEEWDPEDQKIRLPASRTKTQAARDIRLDVSPAAMELLRVLRLRVRGDRVFPGWGDDQWRSTQPRLLRMGAPPFTMHAIRRSTGTLLACSPGIGMNCWNVAQSLGHSVQVAEKHYVGALSGISPTATTLEAAAGIEAVADKIIKAAGGVLRGFESNKVRSPEAL